MNIKESHNSDKAFSVSPLFKGELGTVAAIQIKKGERFPEHVTKTPALLVCVSGKAIFQYESGQKQTLKSGDYINITPNEKHWVDALEESQLLLMK
jgi:quercetin dioxygenase-like cupin family protein